MRSNLTIAKTFRFSTAEDDRVATLYERKKIKAEWVSRMLSDLPDLEVARQPAHHLLMF
jgi:hypothetical protein